MGTKHPFANSLLALLTSAVNSTAPSIEAERAGFLLPSMLSSGAQAIDDRNSNEETRVHVT